jgi:hypothetical protein
MNFTLVRAAAIAAGIAASCAAFAQLTLTPVATGFTGIIGIDHHPLLNQVVISANYPTGQPFNFLTIDGAGVQSGFSSINGLTDEIKIATAKDTLGGFAVGELFTGNGLAGNIVRIAPLGGSVQNPWVVLSSEPGLMRGSLYVDRTGVFGGDLIVATTTGGVWRISSAVIPIAIKLAQINTHLEGLIVMPNNPVAYGPWAGKILIGAENQGRFYTVDTVGTVTPYVLTDGVHGVVTVEDLDLIPANQNFFGVNFGTQQLLGAGPSQFATMVGDLLVTQEGPGYLWRVHWNNSTSQFETTWLGPGWAQWEHVTFSSAGISNIPPPDPNCIPRSQGYWKTHAALWPVESLVLGSENYTKAELLALLGSPSTKDASIILARQLIAAKLNAAMGCDASSVAAVIVDADTLFSAHSGKLPYGVRPQSAEGQQMVNDGWLLDVYNNSGN